VIKMNAKTCLLTVMAVALAYGCSPPITGFDRVKLVEETKKGVETGTRLEVRALCEKPMQGVERRKVIVECLGEYLGQGVKSHLTITETTFEDGIIRLTAEINAKKGSPVENYLNVERFRKLYEGAERKEEGWKDAR
jgi:hypothetical protein